MWKMSETGLDMLKRHEGFRDQVYDDLAPGKPYGAGEVLGTLTIGYGHTRTAPELVGETITHAEGLALLKHDLQRFERGVFELVRGLGVTQNQFDALVSFAFNVGLAALEHSTLLRKLRDGDVESAADEFERWVYSGGKKLAGLENRRRSEKLLFLGRL